MLYSKEELDNIRKKIKRRKTNDNKVVHDEMFNEDYWIKNRYKGFKGLNQEMEEMQKEFEVDRLVLSCNILKKAKNLKSKQSSLRKNNLL